MAASREHQGLQIALIIFVMLTVILGITTYMFYSKSQEEFARNDALIKAADDWEKKATQEQGKFLATLKYQGISDEGTSNEAADKVKIAWEETMNRYAPAMAQPAEDLDYRKVIKYLDEEVQKQDKEIVRHVADIEKVRGEKTALQTAHKAAITRFEGLQQKSVTDLAQVTQDYINSKNTFRDQSTAFSNMFNAKAADVVRLTQENDAKLQGLNKAYTDLEKEKNAIQKKFTQTTDVDLEHPDGEISHVDQRARRVYINLGSADGLKTQITFSVHGSNAGNIAASRPKAEIEVMRVDDRISEARILTASDSDPIVKGDKIFSPTWAPGRSLHFALTGIMDIDGDGKSDLRRVHTMVQLNNGVVDSQMDEDGSRKGRIDYNTNYLVIGNAPSDKAALDVFSAMQNDAEKLGVKSINIARFMELMGRQAPRRTVQLGRGASSDDFAPRRPGGGAKQPPAGEFQPRKAPRKTTQF